MDSITSDKINILKAIAISYVVIGHMDIWNNTLFPPYSFHLALFFFISGMLFKEKYLDNVFEYIKKRIKSLLVPYYLYFAIYGFITYLVFLISGKWWGYSFDLKTILLTPFLNGHQLDFMCPLWFVPQLFITLITFLFLQRCLKNKNVAVKLGLYIGLCILSTVLAKIYEPHSILLVMIRTMFSLFFVYLGNLYFKNPNKINLYSPKITGFVFIFHLFLWIYIGYKFESLDYILVWGNFNGHISLPIITSLTGIWFCLFLVNLMYDYVKNIKFVKLIGENTYHIMANHLFIMWVMTRILMWIYPAPLGGEGVGMYAFHNLEYHWFLYYIISVTVSVLIGITVKKLKKHFISTPNF